MGRTTLLGGTPLRVVRLSEAGAGVLDGLLAGAPAAGAGAGGLARRLTDSGLADPVIGRPSCPGPPRPAEPEARRGSSEGARPLPAGPAVSVVIPVHDRAAGLAATLRALRAAGASGPVEVVVVDDATPDAGQVPDVVAASGTAAVVLRRDRRGGPAAARNTGWRAARADLVAFVDADCEPAPGWLGRLLPHFEDPSLAAVAPRVTAVAAAGSGRARRGAPPWLLRYEQARSPLDLGRRAGPVRPGSRIAYLPSAALVARRAALEAAGGFDESLHIGEDVDLVWRLAGRGWRLRYEPSATVGHPVRPTLGAALRQRRDYGTSAQPLAARHGQAAAPAVVSWEAALAWAAVVMLPSPRRWVPSPLAAAGVVAAAGSTAWRLRSRTGLPAATLLRVAATAHLAGGRSLAEAARRSWWPLALAVAVARPRAGRRLAVAVLTPLLIEWPRAGYPLDPPRWVGLRLADDLTYGWGVWAGCWRGGSARALLPRRVR